MRPPSGGELLPKATLRDTLAVALGVALPTIAKGVIVRRPRVVALVQVLELDGRAVRTVQRLREKYGGGPLMLRTPGQPRAVLLLPQHVHRVLHGTPEPFAAASSEKRAALAHFEPKVALITHGPKRTERRRFNEAVLETSRPVHRLAGHFASLVEREINGLLARVRARGNDLVWDDFIRAWFRIIRSIVLGEAARDDEALTRMQERLRRRANWAFFAPVNRAMRRRFHERLEAHLARGEPGSLAAVIANTPTGNDTAPSHQVAQWLFAFDPAGMATFRTLALLASHPEQCARARSESGEAGAKVSYDFPYLRTCLLESLRLWPTTPMVLRQSTRETEWESGRMPANTGILIFAPYFHRNEQLPYAHRFAPEVWLQENREWPLIPFSAGPAICPAHNLVPMVASMALAKLIAGGDVSLLAPPELGPDAPLPGTLNNYALRFRCR